jgi:hypothetical protein
MAKRERYERYRKRYWQGWRIDPRQLKLPFFEEE